MGIIRFDNTQNSKVGKIKENYVTDSKTKLDRVNVKIVIIKDGRSYMLKFATERPTERREGHKYDHLTECLACKVAKKLGYYDGKKCVGRELFKGKFITFGLSDESVLSSVVLEDGEDYDIEWTLDMGDGTKIDAETKEFSNWVWNTFILDMYVGDYDRHNEYRGTIYDTERGIYMERHVRCK